MKRPSRDQLGRMSSPGSLVTWRRPEPSTPIVQTSAWPFPATESKAIERPSGDQRGDPCCRPGPRVRRVGFAPSASASQISSRARPPGLEGDPPTVGRVLGEHVGESRLDQRCRRGTKHEAVDVGSHCPGRRRDGPGPWRWRLRLPRGPRAPRAREGSCPRRGRARGSPSLP